MKQTVSTALDITSVLTKLFLAAICYKVHQDLTILMVLFYLFHVGFAFYYAHLQLEEDKAFLEQVKTAIEKSSKDYERNKAE